MSMNWVCSKDEKDLLDHHPNFARLVDTLYAQHIVPGIGASQAAWQAYSGTRAHFDRAQHEWLKCRRLYELLVIDGLILDPSRQQDLIPLPLHDPSALIHEPHVSHVLSDQFHMTRDEQERIFQGADAKLKAISAKLLQLVQVSGLASSSSSISVLQRLILILSAVEESKQDTRNEIQKTFIDYMERSRVWSKSCLDQVESELSQLEPQKLAAERKKKEGYHQYLTILLESLYLKLNVLYHEQDSLIYDETTRSKLGQLEASIESDMALLDNAETNVSAALQEFYQLGPEFVSVVEEYQKLQQDTESMQQELFNLQKQHGVERP